MLPWSPILPDVELTITIVPIKVSFLSDASDSRLFFSVNFVVVCRYRPFRRLTSFSSLKDRSVFTPSAAETRTNCPWKGIASYYDIDAGNGERIKDAAWYYPAPKDKAMRIKDHVAFYKSKVDIDVQGA